MIVKFNCFFILGVFFLRQVHPQTDDDTCPSLECCEKDCCGPGSSWDGSYCVLNFPSPGWDGSPNDQSEDCVSRTCCEASCCTGVLIYDGGYCVTPGVLGAITPPDADPTVSPSPSMPVASTTSPAPSPVALFGTKDGSCEYTGTVTVDFDPMTLEITELDSQLTLTETLPCKAKTVRSKGWFRFLRAPIDNGVVQEIIPGQVPPVGVPNAGPGVATVAGLGGIFESIDIMQSFLLSCSCPGDGTEALGMFSIRFKYDGNTNTVKRNLASGKAIVTAPDQVIYTYKGTMGCGTTDEANSVRASVWEEKFKKLGQAQESSSDSQRDQIAAECVDELTEDFP